MVIMDHSSSSFIDISSIITTVIYFMSARSSGSRAGVAYFERKYFRGKVSNCGFESINRGTMERLVLPTPRSCTSVTGKYMQRSPVGSILACMEVIEKQLKDTKGLCEYALYIKAMIKRQQGKIQESLQLFQAATCLNPTNLCKPKAGCAVLIFIRKAQSSH